MELQVLQIFPDKWMVGFEPADNDEKLNYKIIHESTRHAFWDSSREWKVERAVLEKEYVHPHGAFSKFKIDSSIITFSLELKRTQSYWEVLYLLPLILTSALSACGLIIPIPSGEQLGYQITLFLTLAIYTAQFQEELPVWSMYKETPRIAYLVIICIFVNGISCLVSIGAYCIFYSGETSTAYPGELPYHFCIFMDKVLFYLSCGKLDYIIPRFQPTAKVRQQLSGIANAERKESMNKIENFFLADRIKHSVDWKEPEKLFATRTIRERRIPSFTGRSHLESRFIHEIDNGEEKDKLNYCWQMYAKMLCLCFGLVFLNLIFLATVVPIGFIYVNEELKPGERLEKTFKCPWTALCPDLDCKGEII